MTQLRFFCSKGMTSSVKRMLDMKSIDVEAKIGGKEDGRRCLMTAALHGHLDICRLLIEKGAQVKAKGWNDYTPLHRATHYGHIEIVRLLCDLGADVEARITEWPRGSRPLHMAVACGHISIMKELIEVRNADINARDDDGDTVLFLARRHGKANIIAYLISCGAIEHEIE
jgi:cytohesin